ncbi:hypothetical protein HMPREF0495_00281 [Levilactobacillus brevis ATCC 14869 = DSM 20054]|uniref:Uncharacterized protein n=1 Tax=Levilactobacillus brevis ATCC 14869 = DSM 20054 TaxID=649758 RepID=U2PNV4_LEVBR|nr:hypothetical protein HMPREF0495_00281 [Levilactobacillus brevis ATCC 14869 = DSM 20054]
MLTKQTQKNRSTRETDDNLNFLVDILELRYIKNVLNKHENFYPDNMS